MTALAVARLLAMRGDTLAVAESSTGGLILSQLTDVAGASVWLRGGLVPYTNNAKRDILGVPQETLAVYGAVSAETALALARGAARLFDATWAIGETGIAAPAAGRRSAKAAGLTYLAIVGVCDGSPIERIEQRQLDTVDDRVAVKRAFADAALALMLEILTACSRHV